MTASTRVLLAVLAAVAGSLALVGLATQLPGLAITPGWWVMAAIIPALVAAPVAWTLVQQTEAIVRLNRELLLAQDELRRQAHFDGLTGLHNRAGLAWAAGQQPLRDSHLLFLDLDDFKRINDRHGHAAGDAALRHLAAVLRATVGPAGVPARIGGEEFAVLLPGTDAEAGFRLAERLRAAIAEQRFTTDTGMIGLTASIGIAALADAGELDGALRRADRAMYRAKRAGRNRVETVGVHAAG